MTVASAGGIGGRLGRCFACGDGGGEDVGSVDEEAGREGDAARRYLGSVGCREGWGGKGG